MKAQVLHKYDPTMKATQWVTMENVPDARITKSTDVIVRIGGAGVCRTDLHIIEGLWQPTMDPTGTKLLPLIMGHENAGWIEDVGSEVEGLKKGDPVIMHPKVTNGTCIACRRGHDMHGDGTFPGVDCNGGYAEALTTSQRNIVKLPQSLTPKEVAPYADAGLTAYRAAKKASRHLLPGEYVVVLGVGGLGHIGIQCLTAMCAAEVIAVDTSDIALQLAKEIGAHHVVKADGNEVEAIKALTGGKGPHVIFDPVCGALFEPAFRSIAWGKVLLRELSKR
jgi:NAD+-dependent secondary alcohol dehydrogenase Adh1